MISVIREGLGYKRPIDNFMQLGGQQIALKKTCICNAYHRRNQAYISEHMT